MMEIIAEFKFLSKDEAERVGLFCPCALQSINHVCREGTESNKTNIKPVLPLLL